MSKQTLYKVLSVSEPQEDANRSDNKIIFAIIYVLGLAMVIGSNETSPSIWIDIGLYTLSAATALIVVAWRLGREPKLYAWTAEAFLADSGTQEPPVSSHVSYSTKVFQPAPGDWVYLSTDQDGVQVLESIYVTAAFCEQHASDAWFDSIVQDEQVIGELFQDAVNRSPDLTYDSPEDKQAFAKQAKVMDAFKKGIILHPMQLNKLWESVLPLFPHGISSKPRPTATGAAID